MSVDHRRPSAMQATSAVAGSAAGAAATMAMVLAAGWLYRRLPPPQRYPLPPRELVESLLARTSTGRGMNEDGRAASTLAAHFAFGAAAGALFGFVSRGQGGRPVAAGAIYGLVLWASGYFGWVPALGLLRNARTHPPLRNVLMASVHVVWGGVLGLFHRRLLELARGPFGAGRLHDR